MPELLCETDQTGSVQEAAGVTSGRTITVDLITPGWGSSGYYSPQVLEQAARDGVFGAGLHMYADHPSASEDADRPERSIRDLAAVTTTDAKWNPERQALEAQARVFAPFQRPIADMAEAIGVSIRAAGEIEHGEAEGRSGRIVTKLSHASSADFVTRAGRGGKITSLMESARTQLAEARNVGQHLESRLHQDFTNRADDMAANGHLSRDERIHLSNAVGKGLAAFSDHLEGAAPQLYQRDIYDEPDTATARVTAESATTVPAGPGAGNTTTPKEGLVPELTEAEVTQLRESAARAEAAERQLAEANTRLAALTARDTARPLVAARLAEAAEPLPPLAQARVADAVLAAGVPTLDTGAVNTEALHAAVEAAATTERAYLAALAPAATGAVYGAFGSHQAGERTSGGSPLAEAEDITKYETESARIFGRATTGV